MKIEMLNELNRPIIISGPCSAETEEQMMTTAKRIKAGGKVAILRAGIWKPRTRPDSFAGVGEIGLKWLIDAGVETGLPVITEVANAKHVELTLKAGFKKLWIGARTSANPFAVQEIADSLKGVRDIEILVKNPINPDLGLWIGAIERILRADIENVHAIHRGFSSYKSKKYRNIPTWEIPLELRRIFPDIKLICDPSHITGKRDLLHDVAQKAFDLVYDGLMIETHANPDEAWSDAEQQITPEQLGELLDDLILRKVSGDNADFEKGLTDYRQKINSIDSDIIHLISKRMDFAEKIGSFKKEHNITIFQPKRWNDIKKHQSKIGKDSGLSEMFLDKFLEAIHQESIRHQTDVMNKE